jgi:hypothetical protein
LVRIESAVFSDLSLQSIVIPEGVQFIDSSAFTGVQLSSIWIESRNETFVVEYRFVIDVMHHKLILNLVQSSEKLIPNSVEILGSGCFSSCKSLSSITFESGSRLTRIESAASRGSSLQSIIIPSSVEVLRSKCFSCCRSLSSISIESGNEIFVTENGFLVDFLLNMTFSLMFYTRN